MPRALTRLMALMTCTVLTRLRGVRRCQRRSMRWGGGPLAGLMSRLPASM